MLSRTSIDIMSAFPCRLDESVFGGVQYSNELGIDPAIDELRICMVFLKLGVPGRFSRMPELGTYLQPPEEQ